MAKFSEERPSEPLTNCLNYSHTKIGSVYVFEKKKKNHLSSTVALSKVRFFIRCIHGLEASFHHLDSIPISEQSRILSDTNVNQ